MFKKLSIVALATSSLIAGAEMANSVQDTQGITILLVAQLIGIFCWFPLLILTFSVIKYFNQEENSKREENTTTKEKLAFILIVILSFLGASASVFIALDTFASEFNTNPTPKVLLFSAVLLLIAILALLTHFSKIKKIGATTLSLSLSLVIVNLPLFLGAGYLYFQR